MDAMGDDVQRALGRLEGRITAQEARQKEAEDRHVRENAELRAAQVRMDEKLDAILTKLNQGIGGLRVGILVAGIVSPIVLYGVQTLWKILSK
jgi:hypothetical protein